MLTWTDPSTGRAVMAVADGHGHKLHFRSDTGAALAVISAVEELRRTLPRLADLAPGAGTGEVATDEARVQAVHALLRETGSALVATWTEKVGHHLAAHPYSATEVESGAADDRLRAYGATILATAAVGDLMVFLQIGDGDSVVVSSDGEAARPLPEDPDLDGLHTTSLCQADPVAALRVAALDARGDRVALAFLCSDGFSRPRVDADGWWRETGQQLLDFSRQRGLTWVKEQLPDWLAEPARVGGDDTTMALLIRSDVTGISRPDLADTIPTPDTTPRAPQPDQPDAPDEWSATDEEPFDLDAAPDTVPTPAPGSG
ncbi:PP2C family serine/threonine-protein phosphatase [Nocardioides caeni]